MHITKATLEYLGDKFEVEVGGGASREPYLADHKVESYLIIPPKVKNFIFSIFILYFETLYELLRSHITDALNILYIFFFIQSCMFILKR